MYASDKENSLNLAEFYGNISESMRNNLFRN